MKKLLIVVDFQNDFVNGSLGFPKAVAIEKAIAEKIKAYRKENCQIAFTFDTHDKGYLQTQEGLNLPISHCLKGTDGWELCKEIAKLRHDDDLCFEKPSFGSGALFTYLQGQQLDCIELVGVVSNICVISNAVLAKAALPEAQIIVDALCTASNDEELNEAALDVMQSLQIKVINR